MRLTSLDVSREILTDEALQSLQDNRMLHLLGNLLTTAMILFYEGKRLLRHLVHRVERVGLCKGDVNAKGYGRAAKNSCPNLFDTNHGHPPGTVTGFDASDFPFRLQVDHGNIVGGTVRHKKMPSVRRDGKAPGTFSYG